MTALRNVLVVVAIAVALGWSFLRLADKLDKEAASALAPDPYERFVIVLKQGYGTRGPDVTILRDRETGCLYFMGWNPVLGSDGQPDCDP